VYLICAVPVEQVSGWLLACATEVFASLAAFQGFAEKKLVPEAVAEAEI